MAEKKGQTIVIKKVKGGHGGGHGGAWKVAYADFVTAMMCFFLVMWLMGADEETKAAIAQYFIDPDSVNQGATTNETSQSTVGRDTGAGTSALSGMEGFFPEDLIRRQQAVAPQLLKQNQEILDLAYEVLEGQIYATDVNIENMKFSLPEIALFEPGSTTIAPHGYKTLDKIGQLLKGFPGNLTITSHTSDDFRPTDKYTSAFEFTMAQSVAVFNELTKSEKNWIAAERVNPPQGYGTRNPASDSHSANANQTKNRRIEFQLSRMKKP